MIRRFFSEKALNIFTLEIEEWQYPIHNHNFYELILVEKGSGKHIINDVHIDYRQGDVFFMDSEDTHRFVIEHPTKFGFIQFTEQILEEKAYKNKTSQFQYIASSILNHPNTYPENIVDCSCSRKKIFKLYDIIRSENAYKDVYSREMILELFGSIIVMVARSLRQKINYSLQGVVPKNNNKISYILAYIRQNIIYKEKITTKRIADTFYMSPHYVNYYIKKNTGKSLRTIITDSKMNTAKRLLKQSNLTISEISQRLDFVDSSHFNKTFKKHIGENPKTYRQGLLGIKKET